MTERDQAWRSQANCKGTDPNVFFPAANRWKAEWMWDAAAKAVCAGCQVRSACLAWAQDNHEHQGVWGGLNPAERATLAKKLRERARRTAG